MEFLIFEKWAQHTHTGRQNQFNDGIEAQAFREGESPSEVLNQWLTDKAEAYGISSDESETFTEDSNGRIVWEPGDTCATFGDYWVCVWPVENIQPGSALERAAIKANLIPQFDEQ